MYNVKTMLANIAITLLILLPQFDAHAEGDKKNLNVTSYVENSSTLFNQAVDHFNANKLGLSKSFVEQSLYLNPLNTSARKLNREIFDKLTEQNGSAVTESINEFYKFLDFIPPFFTLFLLLLSSFLLVFKFTKLIFLERSTFQTKTSSRMHCNLLLIGVLGCLALHLLKEKSLSDSWACIASPQIGLYTGPNKLKFVQTASLDEGSCVKIVKINKKWVSLKPRQKASGWAEKKGLVVLRGSKFDPPFNKD